MFIEKVQEYYCTSFEFRTRRRQANQEQANQALTALFWRRFRDPDYRALFGHNTRKMDGIFLLYKVYTKIFHSVSNLCVNRNGTLENGFFLTETLD